MTKILVLADVHGHHEIAAAIAKRHSDIDAILIAGDITNFGDVDAAKAVIGALTLKGGTRDIHAVAGNCDPLPVRRYLGETGLSVDGKALELSFGTIVGTGGGLKRAGLTSYERTESEFRGTLENWLAIASGEGRKRPLIVMTHSPPYGTNGDRLGGKHVGSVEFAKMMLRHLPDVWICGHIHESRCVSLEDGTLVINPGPCSGGCYALLWIEKSPDGKALVRAELSR